MKKSNQKTFISAIILILFMITDISFGADALFVSPSGSVGIATSSPSGNLMVAGGGELYLNDLTAGGNSNLRFMTQGTTIGWIYAEDADTSLRLRGGSTIDGIVIKADGKVGIGHTVPTQKLSVNGTAGKTGGGTWETFSDIRLKTDIRELTNAVDLISDYPKPILFKWKNPEEHENQTRDVIGLSAQDLEEVNPEMVSEGELVDSRDANLTDGKVKSIFFSNEFFALQLGAVQELIERVEALETENQLIKKEVCKQKGTYSFCK